MDRIFSIDSEYHTPLYHKTQRYTIIFYKYVLMGVYDVQYDNYDYLVFEYDSNSNSNSKYETCEQYMNHISTSILNHLFSKLQEEENARVYSFYLSAELQFIFYTLANNSTLHIIEDETKFKHFQLENDQYKTEVMYSDRPLLVKITEKPTAKSLTFVDIQKLTNATTLESLVEGMGLSSEQYHKFKKQRRDIKQLSKDELIEYNRLDCILQYKALLKFNEYLLKLLNKEYTCKINSLLEGVTMGSYLVKYFHQYNKELQRYHALMNKNFYTQEDTMLLQKYQQYRDNFYYGGGINHNLVQFNTTLENVYMVDFNSLYPISMVIALTKLPARIEDIKHVINEKHEIDELGINFNIDINELINKLNSNNNFYYFVRCKLQVNDNSLVCENVKMQNEVIQQQQQQNKDKEYTSRNVICKHMTVVLSKDEFMLELQHNNIEYYEIIELWYWKIDKQSWSNMYNDICALIIKRLELKKQKDSSQEANALQYILKILLNSLYGKFAEKRVTKLTYPILASLITAISRYIMRKIAYILKEQNVQIYHFATDSIICSNFNYDMIKQVHDEIVQYINVDKVMSVEIDPSTANTCRIVRHKVYAFFNNKEDELVKEAHHAIHLDRNNKKQEMLRLIKTLDEGKHILHFVREGWIKYDDVIIESNRADTTYFKYFCMQRYELNVSVLLSDRKIKEDGSKYDYAYEYIEIRKKQERIKNKMKRHYLIQLCLDAYSNKNNKVDELVLYAPKLLQQSATAKALRGEYRTSRTRVINNNRRVRLSVKEKQEHDKLIEQVLQYLRSRGEVEVSELMQKFKLNKSTIRELYRQGCKSRREWRGNKSIRLISYFSEGEPVDPSGNKVPPIL